MWEYAAPFSLLANKCEDKNVCLNAKSLQESNLKIYCSGKEQSQHYDYLLRLSISFISQKFYYQVLP